MDYQLLKNVVDKLEQFERENPNEKFEMQGFGLWLGAQNSNELECKNKALKVNENLDNEIKVETESAETVIAQLLTFLSRYLKIYLKKGLEGTLLSTGDDFTYLATLLNIGDLTKTELIQLNAHEKTSGMEVIKRLLNKNLILQFDDAIDKRSKRVKLTEMGKEVLFKSFNEMTKVAQICVADLNETEKKQLVFLLKKLDNFHNDIYLNHHDKGLDEIMSRKNILSNN